MPNLDIILQGASKRFGSILALQPTNLTIASGQFVLLAGANGAGKSTLLRVIAGVSKLSSGDILIHGLNVKQNKNILSEVGFLSHQTQLYEDLSIEENLLFFARLYGLAPLGVHIERIIEFMGLKKYRKRKVREISQGMRQRVALARTTLHKPSIVLFDEPYTGLDINAQELLKAEMIRLKSERHTCLFITHDMQEAAPLIDRIIIINSGRVALDQDWRGSGAELSQLYEYHMNKSTL